MSPSYHTQNRKTIAARKSLGQNFLADKNKIGKIIDALDLKDDDTIIEIGPGHGELTGDILKKRPAGLIAIEKDERLAGELEKSLEGREKIKIVAGDALRVLPKITAGLKNYKIVGNVPYYITGFLLRVLGGLTNKPKLIVLTVQKEVAERITAQPPRMNLLAANVQMWAEAEMLGIVPRTSFYPVPKVDSAIVRIATLKILPTEEEVSGYERVARALFKQPRKTILNNLLAWGQNREEVSRISENVGINPNDRPQALSPASIKKLAEIIYNND